jgi:hypothetical protein
MNYYKCPTCGQFYQLQGERDECAKSHEAKVQATDPAIFKRIFTVAGESMGVDPERLAQIVADFGLEELIDGNLGCRCFDRKIDSTSKGIVKVRADLFDALNDAHVDYNASMGVTP